MPDTGRFKNKIFERDNKASDLRIDHKQILSQQKLKSPGLDDSGMFPNFLEAIFQANDFEKNGVFIADKYQFEYMEKALMDFYKIVDEKELDARNTID